MTLSLQTLVAQRERAIYVLNQEREWMAEHGDTREAYVARYGSASDAEHYGDGGEAIYAADKAALDRAEAAALEATRKAREAREASQRVRRG